MPSNCIRGCAHQIRFHLIPHYLTGRQFKFGHNSRVVGNTLYSIDIYSITLSWSPAGQSRTEAKPRICFNKLLTEKNVCLIEITPSKRGIINKRGLCLLPIRTKITTTGTGEGAHSQSSIMLEVICMLIGRLLLILVAAYDLIWQLRQSLHALVYGSYDYWRSTAARERQERAVLERCRSECTKLPQHLVLIIAPYETNVDVVVLMRLFGYALEVGIKHISVYDRRDQGKGYVDLAALGETQVDERFIWPRAKVPKDQENGHKLNNNGYSNGGAHFSKQLKLYQIDSGDGHALIADVCRDLYKQRNSPLVQNLLQDQRREALTEQINEMLAKRLGFIIPEPELGLIFARQTCTYGLLPWHVRFTEFHTHPSGRYFDVESFTQVLYKYARCEQRWGK